jgi:hypothetical protein
MKLYRFCQIVIDYIVNINTRIPIDNEKNQKKLSLILLYYCFKYGGLLLKNTYN